MLCETPELSFCFWSWGRGKGWGGGEKLEELFYFLGSELHGFRARVVWPGPTCDSEAVSSRCTPHPGRCVGPDPGHESRAPRCPCRIRPAGRDPSGAALACHTWATTVMHVTLLALGHRCKARGATEGGELDLKNAQHLLHPDAFVTPQSCPAAPQSPAPSPGL